MPDPQPRHEYVFAYDWTFTFNARIVVKQPMGREEFAKLANEDLAKLKEEIVAAIKGYPRALYDKLTAEEQGADFPFLIHSEFPEYEQGSVPASKMTVEERARQVIAKQGGGRELWNASKDDPEMVDSMLRDAKRQR